jgi:uncharacterized membrane protein
MFPGVVVGSSCTSPKTTVKNHKRVPTTDPDNNQNGTSTQSPSDHAIEAVAKIERTAYEARSRMDHFADTITRFAGSGTAILIHLIWFFLWLVANLHFIPGITPFDPFPFNLLTMVVSLEAIFLTLFVLISQNRMSQEADKRAQLDLQVNLLAEKETTMILQMLAEISDKLGVDKPLREDLKELLKETRVDDLAKKLEEALPSTD